jgi:hypothetical protein
MKKHILLKPILFMLMILAFGLSQPFAVLAAPPNDDFDDATLITELPFTDSTDTSEATRAGDDPLCVGEGSTVWYAFTPNQDMSITADTFGSDYDTILSVYTGWRGNLFPIACNDDTASLQSRVAFDAMANETYYIMVGAFGDMPGGNLVFNVYVSPPPLEFDLSIDPVGLVKASTGMMTLSGQVTCSRPASVYIYGDVQQRAGRSFIRGYFYNAVWCDGETVWKAGSSGENGIFKPGKADVNAFASASTGDGEYASDSETLTVRLRGQGKYVPVPPPNPYP